MAFLDVSIFSTYFCRLLRPYGLLLCVVNAWFLFVTPALSETKTILVMGDSLTAGYGLAETDSFPAQLERSLSKLGRDVRIINSGVSGDTSAGGRARLDWALAENPDAVILELGANDGLRGLDPRKTEANLGAMIREIGKRKIPILLTGMRAPPNLGPEYEAEFNGLYRRLARRHKILLYPFFLEGVAAIPSLNQADAIHPNAEGVAEIVNRIRPMILQLIDEIR